MAFEENIILRCLIIMPYSQTSEVHTEEYWQNHYHKFLKPLIEEVPNIEAFRIKPIRGDIVKQIITNLVTSPMIVAELTDHNPNVFWELGVRQSFKHNTITIAEEGTPLPFDISSKATLFYDPKDHLKMQSFRKKLKAALELCKSDSEESDSHVLETISGRGSFLEILRLDEVIRRIEALLSEIKMNKRVLKDLNNIRKYVAQIAIFKKIKYDPEKSLSRLNSLEQDIENFASYIDFLNVSKSAIKLLVVNRYVNANKAFYGQAESYLMVLNRLEEFIKRIQRAEKQGDNFSSFKRLFNQPPEIFRDKKHGKSFRERRLDRFEVKVMKIYKELKTKYQLFNLI
jgi:hypothetical protein